MATCKCDAYPFPHKSGGGKCSMAHRANPSMNLKTIAIIAVIGLVAVKVIGPALAPKPQPVAQVPTNMQWRSN